MAAPAIERLRNLVVFGLVCWYLIVLVGLLASGRYTFGDDLRAYWTAWEGGGLYETGASVGQLTFLYSPAFAQAFWPLTLLSWPVLRLGWAALTFGTFGWLAWPLPLRLRLAALGIGCCSTLIGNLDWLIALSLALSLRYPATWAAILLSKITPGIGLLWFAVRGEWRSLAVAGGVTALLVGVSVAISPALWVAWIDVLTRSFQGQDASSVSIGMPPLSLRLVTAAGIIFVGALRDWRPAIVVAALIASPDIWPWTPAILLAIPRLGRRPDVADRCDPDAVEGELGEGSLRAGGRRERTSRSGEFESQVHREPGA